MLAELKKGKPGPKELNHVQGFNSDYRQAITDADIGKNQAARWQQVAAVSDETFFDYIQAQEEKWLNPSVLVCCFQML